MNSIDSVFFVFDSDCLENVVTYLYGYAVTEDGIIEERNRSEDDLGTSMGGCYVMVKANERSIRLTQDSAGSMGIYVYREPTGYFAVSNSFFKLLEHVSSRGCLTPNVDFINHFVAIDLCGLAYRETAVNEISEIDRDEALVIDKQSRTLSEEYCASTCRTVPADTDEYFKILDRWYARWVKLFSNLADRTSNIVADLSGGFDSRLCLLLLLNANVDFKKVQVFSKVSTHPSIKEDYEIAASMARQFGFSLANQFPRLGKVMYTFEEAVDIAFNVKMCFHKMLSLPVSRSVDRLFRLAGGGGESIRDHWEEAPEKFIRRYVGNLCSKLPQSVKKSMSESITRVLQRSLQGLARKYELDESAEILPQLLYQDVRNRNHFGKISFESYLAGTIYLYPLMDADLAQLAIADDRAPDKNLLVAIILQRYCPDLLLFPFEGGRRIAPETIQLAKEICSRHQRNVDWMQSHDCNKFSVCPTLHADITQAKGPRITSTDVDDYLRRLYKSNECRAWVSEFFSDELYNVELERMASSGFVAYRNYYALLGCWRAFSMTSASSKARPPSDVLSICSTKEVVAEAHEKVKMKCDVISGGAVELDLDIEGIGLMERNVKAAVLLVRFLDSSGRELRVVGLSFSERFSCCFLYLPALAGMSKSRFRVNVPQGAKKGEFKVVPFACDGSKFRVVNFSVRDAL